MATIATVSPTELIRSTWGNSVAVELNTRCVKVDGSTPVTGTLIVTGSPGLALRHASNTPYLTFESSTGTRYGYIQGTPTSLRLSVDSASAAVSFAVADTQKFYVNATDTGVQNNLTVFGTSTMHAAVAVGGNGDQLSLIDTATSGSNFYNTNIAFYGSGVSLVSPGTRSGWVGFGGNSTMYVSNEVSGGGVTLAAAGSAAIIFSTAAAERGRIVAADLLWGKTSADAAVAGAEISSVGRFLSTVSAAGNPNLYMRHIGSASGEGSLYAQFADAGGTVVATVTQDATAPAGIYINSATVTAPSDYRMKNDLGPVVNALARLMQLEPKHLAWKQTGAEFDGFLAHEVDAVVPDAVRGAKDATYSGTEAALMGVPTGTVKPQQLDVTAIIPLLTAAVQELAGRVEAL